MELQQSQVSLFAKALTPLVTRLYDGKTLTLLSTLEHVKLCKRSVQVDLHRYQGRFHRFYNNCSVCFACLIYTAFSVFFGVFFWLIVVGNKLCVCQRFTSILLSDLHD